jgi:hypothetical protein
MTYTYDSHGGDTTMRQRDGQPVEVLRAIRRPDTTHDWDVLPMFRIRFPDGTETEAWCDELAPHRHSVPRVTGADDTHPVNAGALGPLV